MTLSHKQARAKHINAYRNSLRMTALANEKAYRARLLRNRLMNKALYYMMVLCGIVLFLTVVASLYN